MDEDGFKMDRKLALVLIDYILSLYIYMNIHLMKGDLKACASDKHRLAHHVAILVMNLNNIGLPRLPQITPIAMANEL